MSLSTTDIKKICLALFAALEETNIQIETEPSPSPDLMDQFRKNEELLINVESDIDEI